MFAPYFLCFVNKKLTCKSFLDINFALCIDFCDKQLQWRLNSLNKQQAFAKSLGLHKKNKSPYVIDATAGLAKDAISMLKLGCHVKMLEQSKIIYLLLEDALLRAKNISNDFLSLLYVDSYLFLQTLQLDEYPDIIYLDPMFPKRLKSAKVKKDMCMLQAIQSLIDSSSSVKLLEIARQRTKHRVVVKRAKNIGFLGEQKPSFSYKGKSVRYDVYLV